MTREDWIADRLDLLEEMASIEMDLVVYEAQHGLRADRADILQRVAAVRVGVLAQLRVLIDRAPASTVH